MILFFMVMLGLAAMLGLFCLGLLAMVEPYKFKALMLKFFRRKEAFLTDKFGKEYIKISEGSEGMTIVDFTESFPTPAAVNWERLEAMFPSDKQIEEKKLLIEAYKELKRK